MNEIDNVIECLLDCEIYCHQEKLIIIHPSRGTFDSYDIQDEQIVYNSDNPYEIKELDDLREDLIQNKKCINISIKDFLDKFESSSFIAI